MTKRIIEGKTFNTETSTKLASRRDDSEYVIITEDLYKNRHGAFFIEWCESDGPDGPASGLRPITLEEARNWLERHRSYDVDLYEQVFGKQPEAGSGESKFTLRLPDALRARLAERAKDNGQSLNAWMIRCLERCAPLEARGRRTRGKR